MKNSAPQPSARQVRCRRTTIESAMDPVPAGTGQQPRIVAGYNLFVVGSALYRAATTGPRPGYRSRSSLFPGLETIHSRRGNSTSAEIAR